MIADGLVDTSSEGDWNIVTLAVVPLLLGIALLVPPRFRVVGAGVVMGLAVGLIVGSASLPGADRALRGVLQRLTRCALPRRAFLADARRG